MGLEVATYIADLVATNPLSTDAVGQGDDHLRLIKSALKNTLPNLGGRLNNVIPVPNGYTVLSTDNTAVLDVPAATVGTISHTISLPAPSSITAGFYFDINLTGLQDVVSLVGTGGGTIEGAATLAAGPQSAVRVFYAGSNAWRVSESPAYRAGSAGLFLDGPVTISGNVHMSGTLSVSGATRLLGNVSISGGLFVEGNSRLGTLTVSGAAHFQSSVSIGGGMTVDADLNAGGRLTVSGTTRLLGELHAASGVSISGVLIASGATRFDSTLTVSGAANFKTTLSVSGATVLGGTLTVSGGVSFLDGFTASGAVHMKTTLSVGGVCSLGSTVTISGTCVLVSGQLKFPATQNASTDANTLDDYEEGTWTPVLTFATPGNLTVVYSIQTGVYTKVGRMVNTQHLIRTSTFTHTTASGNLQITGAPFTSATTSTGPTNWRGVTKANFTDMAPRIDNATALFTIMASGSGQATIALATGDMPTGGTVEFFGQVTYFDA